MKAVICDAPGSLALVDRPEPDAPGPGEALIAIAHVGICGTDYHIFDGTQPYLSYPRIMGHEISARVLAVGEGVALQPGAPVIVNPYLECGHCVACRRGKPNCCTSLKVLGVHTDGAMVERFVLPAKNLYRAEGLALEQAAAVEFLAIGAHAVRRSETPEGSSGLVVGAGPIGLGAALFARIAGQRVTLLDADPERLAFARDRLGFESTVQLSPDVADRLRDATGGDFYDVVYDATGNGRAMEAAFGYVAHGGTLVFVGLVKDPISFSDPDFHRREMTLKASRNATRQDFEHVIASIRGGLVPLDVLLTHRTTLADVPRDLPRWAREKTGLIKAVIAVG